MTWATFERRFKDRTSTFRYTLFKPLLKILASAGIRPNAITYLGLASMFFFVYYINKDVPLAAIFLIINLVLDQIDGPLAYYLKSMSDKGKFTDLLIDNIAFVILVAGIVSIGLISGVIGVLLAYFMFLCMILMILQKNYKRKSDWLITPFAGAYPSVIRAIVYIVFFVYAFFGMNYFNPLFSVLVVLLILKSAQYYFLLKK